MSVLVDTGKELLFGPKPPDVGATVAAQEDVNRRAAYESAALNQINQLGPGYQISYTGEIGDPNRTMTYELDPYREALAQMMGGMTLDQAMMLGGPIDYSGVAPIPGADVPMFDQPGFAPDTDIARFAPGDYGQRATEVEDAMYNALMSRVRPDLERTWDRQTTMAANRGLPMGGEAWDDIQESLARQEQDAILGAGGAAVGLGRDEAQRLFDRELAGYRTNLGAQAQQYGQELGVHQQALQDYLANLGAQGQQFGQQMGAHQQGMQNIGFDRQQIANELAMMHNINPYVSSQVMSPTQYQMAAPDLMGMQQANYGAQVANRGSMMGGLANLGSAAIMGSMMSDRRLKEDIELIGSTYGGVPLYSFRYKGGAMRHSGVMAQDMLFVNPDAVTVMDNGYMAVDYSKVM